MELLHKINVPFDIRSDNSQCIDATLYMCISACIFCFELYLSNLGFMRIKFIFITYLHKPYIESVVQHFDLNPSRERDTDSESQKKKISFYIAQDYTYCELTQK